MNEKLLKIEDKYNDYINNKNIRQKVQEYIYSIFDSKKDDACKVYFDSKKEYPRTVFNNCKKIDNIEDGY